MSPAGLVLSLRDCPAGVETGPGATVVYDLARAEARFGAARVDGPALAWELAREPRPGALLSAGLELDRGVDWLLRCDRVDFPPGGVAHLHTHPGPGIRRLLHGALRVETAGRSETHRPGDAWFERGPDPVLAVASPDEETAFVRVLLLPAEWAGRRTIRYVNEEDADTPKTQRATVFLEVPVELP
ncbi:MAG: hypothetical protein IT201_08020 [Thermoleophilia bacterium]|nr:hypothetical protein [Thermoleophilia bacterium]